MTGASEVARKAASRETILLVEDEPGVARVAARILEHEGYHVLTVSNGEEALRTFRETDLRIDLVLSDWVMPVLNGHELRKALLEEANPPKMLFASGYPLQSSPGANGLKDSVQVLAKPWSSRELLLGVRRALDQN